jgi:TrpR-related protein YerC/YecD
MKIHRIQVSDEKEEPEHKLYQAIAAIKTEDEAKSFFQDLCTPKEIQAMADRWQVVALIKAGMPYRKIYEDTGVSVTTVGRVARCIMLGENGYNIIYERLKKKSYETKNTTKNSDPKKRASP